ncbi:MAG: hypothetical protein GF421_06720 [Candidatus Aminicenantes bacterium]|nr:hypothetical protein [Candidatus Aminicenantes bacterium]
MPAGNRTGPLGQGPRTGRSLGFCSGYDTPGYMKPGPGMGLGRGFRRRGGFSRGMGRGFGRGYGRGWGYYPAPAYEPPYPPQAANVSPEDELKMLKDQSEYLKNELQDISKRMEEIKKKKR